MAYNNFPNSGLPIRRTVDLLPEIFKTESNTKFLNAVVDPLIQPGTLDKTVGYIGRRYGKTYNSKDIYLDNDETLRSRYQLEPGVTIKEDQKIKNFYDYIDFKNQLRFFNNYNENDNKITNQEHYTWNPPIDWDKFINYREYYWVPEFPPDVSISGQAQTIVSTYRITLGTNSYIFSPDGQTNNPTLTLYRGQKYRFNLNIPGHPIFIRSNLDVGTLFYNPNLPYSTGQITVFDGKIWKAKRNIAVTDGSTINEDSQDWELVDVYYDTSSFDYYNGVVNYGQESGIMTFDVPLDAPDVLYYQSAIDPNYFGKFLIDKVESNTKIDVEKEIIGKQFYTSSNNITLSNGMVIRFSGQVTPEIYSDKRGSGKFVVEGVGSSIKLVAIDDLVISPLSTSKVTEILFDNASFDTEPFDDASLYPKDKDYLTIAKSSRDLNSWSRYNRWFHRSVLDYSYQINGDDFLADEQSRAKRPIIEFLPDLKLFNHGEVARGVVDYIDDFTSDIFSKIEGSVGYIVDGEFLFEGARVLVTADTDKLVNNQIYEVKFIVHNGRRQIALIRQENSNPQINECLLIRRGKNNKGLMYHYNGTAWVKSQEKTKVNQSPLFDLFDENEISFSDQENYPVSSFTGTPIISYKPGSGVLDFELGFSISYLNIDNVGDIQFNFDLDSGSFNYKVDTSIFSKSYSTGFYKCNAVYGNGWSTLNPKYLQPIIDTILIDQATNTIQSSAIDFKNTSDDEIQKIVFFINGKKSNLSFVRNKNKFIFEKELVEGDVITIKVFTDIPPDTGYYEIPLGLEKNPLNQNISSFTLGQAADHLSTGLELNDEIIGVFPGSSNLRDISGYQDDNRRFLKHSAPSPLALVLLCDKEINIIKAVQYAKKSYTDFKNNFMQLANELYQAQEPRDFVDVILNEIGNNQTIASPFAGSDMVGSGAFTSLKYTVEDEGIKTFALSEKFDLVSLSSKAVYVYINAQQLIYNKDYIFDSTFGFLTLNLDLNEGDEIEIREYVSTGINFIPPTPTKLGLYKKYLPQKFIDDTYQEPKQVIQGHDGSITTIYGDFRDDLLLELELRIYNNIKQNYDETIFDIDSIIGGYYGNSLYTKTELDKIVASDFLKWIADTNIDYVNNIYLDTENSFTYTYSNMADPTETVNLPGYWRGVYEWFYDTTRPHTCPWEMLGFSEKPDWWEAEYGPAPYTSNNLILWEDLRDGIIRHGTRQGIYQRYKRPSIMSHLPVDGDGKLLSPLDSSLAQNFSLINNKGSFVFGDRGPVEYAWRISSEWPFAVVSALCLMKPFEFITDNFNKSKVKRNKLNQTVCSTTNSFFKLTDFTFNEINKTVSGLHLYVLDLLKNRTKNLDVLQKKITGIDVNLSTRISGFVDANQQKYILDSKNPKSSSSSVFVPNENYDIIFNVGAPYQTISYSGVIIEKTDKGWKVSGYDNVNPIFKYFEPVPSQSDPLISVGGVSENYVDWSPDKFYNNGILVRYQTKYYRAIKSHTSTDNFEASVWKQLPSVPLKNATSAFSRRAFNKLRARELSYNTIFTDIQSVVDFLLGYQEYLKFLGFAFDNYNGDLKEPEDWFTAVKEFMFWSKHNWALGSLLTLSPSAKKVQLNIPLGVADNLLDGFYDYQILQNDGTPLPPNNINVSRGFRSFTVSVTDNTFGIYFIKLNLVLKEHVTLFSDKTVFNDVIYDKPTGYRQERIKSRGFRTVDWDGDYTSPGFIFDGVDIKVWEPFVDYKLGDIVSYKSYFWTSKKNQLGSSTFTDSNWVKLDSTPTKGLVPNFDYRITQFEDYYEVDSAGVGSSQRDLSRHAIGYQSREYLQNLAEDEVSQFRIYQGYIREKGTANSIIKVFDKLSRTQDDSVVLNEEWAFKLGDFGGIDQTKEFEFNLVKDDFVVNPQPILLESGVENIIVEDQYLRVYSSDFTKSPVPFTSNIIPKNYYDGNTRNGGYVKLDHVNFVVKNRDDILNLSISEVVDNSNIWITFEKNSWTILRYNEEPALVAVGVVKDGKNVILTTNRPHNLEEGEIIGIQISNLTGFFKVFDLTIVTFKVTPISTDPVEIEDSSSAVLGLFTTVRYNSYQAINKGEAALLKQGSRLWVDDNGNGYWEVIEKTKQYVDFALLDYGITAPTGTGKSVVYIETLKQIATAVSGSYVMIYTDKVTAGATNIGLKQIIPPPAEFESELIGVFGDVLAISPDNRWLAVGSPLASGIKSKYREELVGYRSYLAGDVVLYQGKLWKAKTNIAIGDGSSINFLSQDWEPATIVEANSTGNNNGYFQQGIVTLYAYVNQQWEPSVSFVSPRQAPNELFGSSISIGVSGSTYYMTISAPGSLDNKGRVYLYYYTGTEWQFLINENYLGLYDPTPSKVYPTGSIVWCEGNYYQALADNIGDGSTLTIESNDWQKLDIVSTQFSLPTNISIDDDGSTLIEGLANASQLAELVKQGDRFGHATTMSRDGSILVISTPTSDGQYFANYKGVWKPYNEYKPNDVVKYQNGYHKFTVIETDNDVSLNEPPDAGDPWVNVGDSTYQTAGKVYIYKRDENKIYQLVQTITEQNINEFNDSTENVSIFSGDEFGYALDIDANGTTLVVSSPKADIFKQTQGAAYIFRTADLDNIEFRLVQKLSSYEYLSNEYFGSAVSISPRTEKIVIGAKNSSFNLVTRFNQNTTFDKNKTRFQDAQGYPGQVYIFERKADGYLLAEKLDTDLIPNESFGASVDCVSNVVVVGSPKYKVNDEERGIIRLFKKADNVNSLKTIAQEVPLVDNVNLKNIELYDAVNNLKLADIDIVDNYKMKILGIADQEIKFKTIYDPATYMMGTEEQIIDESQAWFSKHVGEVWWDVGTAKFLNYEQGDLAYKIGNWNTQVIGSSIDVYEWVESPLLPSEWSVLADTTEGLIEGISGQPKYPNDTVYNTKVITNPNTGLPTGTTYYYWVKNKTTIPEVLGRKISVAEIKNYINNPIGSGLPFISLIDSDKILAYNLRSIMTADNVLLNIEFNNPTSRINQSHKEYQLLTEGVADSLPAPSLERKWIDSLVGYDQAGNVVPDPNLPEKQRYGLRFRPRQSMFVDKSRALEASIDYINDILVRRPFTDLIDFNRLLDTDPPPVQLLNDYDVEVSTLIDLEQVGTVRIKKAEFSVNIINGEIDTIDIIDPGFGYRNAPYIQIEGTGSGATAEVTIDTQGKISSIIVLTKGKKYVSAFVKIRAFSVLVKNDESLNNFWSIYSWDDVRKSFFRSRSQAYDVARYWEYTDWWADGFDNQSRIFNEISNIYQEPTIQTQVGQLLRIKEYGNGGWAVLEKTDAGLGNLLDNYNLVGRQNGTIQIKSILYDSINNRIGYDGIGSYDSNLYDLQPIKELRIILDAVKQDIFVDDLRVEWNNLFFNSVRFALSEQQAADWIFKTSFLNAIHNVGDLDQRPTYKNDNLDNYRDYIEEIKPYKTSVREYTSRYTEKLNSGLATTDFDLPPAYSTVDGKILPISENYNRFDEYPWKSWVDNNGYNIVSIEVTAGGTDYINPPEVIIEGNGTGATAQAYISNGSVRLVRVLTEGSGYTKTPIIKLVGGNGSSRNKATAVAILGNSKIRTFDVALKFDRIDKTGQYSTFTQTQTFVASGSSAVFALAFAPNIDKRYISVTRNDQIVLSSEYVIDLYRLPSDSFNLLRGRIKFLKSPSAGDVIVVNYEKNIELLNSIDRINKYYNPNAGMIGKEYNQLMTGIDFGGVKIQGTTFDVTGGWDALPWFVDNWDSIESSSDFYYVINSEIWNGAPEIFVYDGTNNIISVVGNVKFILTKNSETNPLTQGLDYNFNSKQGIITLIYERFNANDVITIDREYSEGQIVSYNGILYQAITDNINENPETADSWKILKIVLPYVPQSMEFISIYLKRSGDQRATRIDDPNYQYTLDSSTATNISAKMPTFIGDGSTNVVEIQNYINLYDGDTLIFRKIESDGSVTISDINLLDTRISGGSLSSISNAYVTATGITAEEIVIEGEKFVSPDQVPAPEENIPGQVLDSLSIKVYTTTLPGASPIQNKIVIGDGVTKVFDIGLTIFESTGVMVYVDKVKQEYIGDSTINYAIDFVENQIEFNVAPSIGSIIEIIAIGIGGIALLDYQEFIADGNTSLFLTKALYDQTNNVLVTVDGVEIDTGFVNSSDFIDVKNKTMIQFGIPPSFRQVVKIISFGNSAQTDSSGVPFIRVNTQDFIYDGSTRTFELDRFVDLGRNPSVSAVIVEVNGQYLRSSDTEYFIYDGTNSQITLGLDPAEALGSITSGFIKVYVNGIVKRFVLDFTFDGNTNILTLNTNDLNIGDVITIVNDLSANYRLFDNNNLVLDPTVSLNPNDVIKVTWFSEYPSLDIISDEYSGGKVNYKLPRIPLNANYIWVYKNGQRLTKDRDYYLEIPRSVVYLTATSSSTDIIKIVQFGNVIWQPPRAYEISKDMLNNNFYKRYRINNSVKLSKNLNYFDTNIEVTDASNLSEPILEKNVPGVIKINNERIEYFEKNGNILSQLRRGSSGTGVKEVHAEGSYVIDVGASESISYSDTEERTDFLSDGSSKNIGPLDFIPTLTNINNWYRETIPTTHGLCNQIEVFVGGKRLRKNFTVEYNKELAASSPEADRYVEADFSVDGSTPYVRLTDAVDAGTKITIVRKIGRLWYDRGATTATTGVSLLSNQSAIAKFIAAGSSESPE